MLYLYITISTLIALYIYNKLRLNKSDIPGPSVFKFFYEIMKSKNMYGAIQKFRKEYGPVFRGYWFTDVIVTTSEDVHSFFKCEDKPDIMANLMKDILGNGETFYSISNLNGKKWENMRKVLSTVFTHTNLRKKYVDIITCSDRYIQYLKDNRVQQVELCSLAKGITLDTMGKFILKYDFNCLKNFIDGTVHQLDFSVGYLMQVLENRGTSPIAYWKVLPKDKVLESSLNYLKNEVMDIIKNVDPDDDNIVNTLIKSGYSDNDIYDEILGFVIAGFENTAFGLTYFLRAMIENPDIQSKLRTELLKLPINEDGNVDHDYLLKCEYLDACFKENLRLNTIIMLGIRKMIENTKFGYYIVPKDWKVMYMGDTLHKDENTWTDPYVYNPDRFTDAVVTNKMYLPFGNGRRICLGKNYAQLESKAIIYKLLTNFEFIHVEAPVETGVFMKRPVSYKVKISPI